LIQQRVLLELLRKTDPGFSFESAYDDFYRVKDDPLALSAWMQLHPVEKALEMAAEARRLAEDSKTQEAAKVTPDDGTDTVRVFGGDYVQDSHNSITTPE
jgi:hypothetical protein